MQRRGVCAVGHAYAGRRLCPLWFKRRHRRRMINVYSTPEWGHCSGASGCPLCAKSGHYLSCSIILRDRFRIVGAVGSRPPAGSVVQGPPASVGHSRSTKKGFCVNVIQYAASMSAQSQTDRPDPRRKIEPRTNAPTLVKMSRLVPIRDFGRRTATRNLVFSDFG